MGGIYIHIPFCKRKCSYCDFYSVAAKSDSMERYVKAVIDEAEMRIGELGGAEIKTMYVGGGTPSLLSAEQLSQLIGGVRGQLTTDAVQEMTIEVNPDDITDEYALMLHKIGFNRVSMGVQSFNDDELQFINRRHTAQQATDAVNRLRAAGFDNISIDLIYGIPKQTQQTWRESVNQAIALDVQHISCYCLSYEEGTRLYMMRKLGKITECSDEECVAMYSTLVELLKKAGYEHYEISNFAKAGKRSMHNSNYWNFTPYLGLGAAAHSYDGKNRRYNPSNIKEYAEKIGSGATAYTTESEEDWQRYNELVMIRLRTTEGLEAKSIERKFGQDLYRYFVKNAERHVNAGNLSKNDGHYRLSEAGVMLADMVIRDVIYVE
ncbi:MAG: radical SAM family heme chaperone HemW [Muribaculaceae bacterium]|jgi:putative oxygen-independent coproporphyrinogen III oxidase|nr:radical SAM family heme chaperone HemW [Muribaculaceae bacterium]